MIINARLKRIMIVMGGVVALFILLKSSYGVYTAYKRDVSRLLEFELLLIERRAELLDRQILERDIIELTSKLSQKKDDYFTRQDIGAFSRTTIPALFDKHGLILESLSFLAPIKESSVMIYHPLELEFTGDFKSIMQLIYEIEQFEKKLTISSFSFKQTIDPTLLSIVLTLDLYEAGF